MAYASVGEITQNSVLFKQSVHSSGSRMSLPKPIAMFLGKHHKSWLTIDFKKGSAWLNKQVLLESGTEILANGDPDLIKLMRPGATLTLRAYR